MNGRVESVNVSSPKIVEHHGRQVSTSIFKQPVTGPVRVAGANIDGDDQADRRVHGGPDKAIYAYAVEDYQWWGRQLAATLLPARFGENLTTSGIDIVAARVGDRWRVGSAELEVSEPRLPCFKLGIAMNDPDFPDAFTDGGRPGTYLRIISEGIIAAGDEIVVGAVEGESISIGDFAATYEQRSGAQRLLDNPRVLQSWRDWAQRQVERE